MHLFEETSVDGINIADATSGLSDATRKHEIDRLTQWHAIDETLAEGERESLFFINQDSVLADGTLAWAQRQLDGGADAVLIPLLRLMHEASDDIRQHLASQTGEGISADEMCDGMPDNLHPVSRQSISNSSVFTQYPATVLWAVGDIGFIARGFLPVPLAIRARPECRRFDSTIDYDYALNLATGSQSLIVPRDSREAMVAKVTTKAYLGEEAKPNTLTVSRLAHFILSETNKAHRVLVSQSYALMRSNAPDISARAWQEADRFISGYLDETYRFLERLRSALPEDHVEAQAALKSHSEAWMNTSLRSAASSEGPGFSGNIHDINIS